MREENQDAVDFFSFDENNWFLVVADGMGGYAGGSVASKIVVKSLIKEFKNLDLEQLREKPQLYMRKAINTANSAVN
ncbi:protein phosphatase 2C domain-containing protein, partial [Myxococcota bacterium]|nr:protein phosphatase 2C domain-containing protein [Myxococcota bacterium]